jgi:uncharacterized OB-fold protein
MTEAPTYLPAGLPIPLPEPDGLSAPFWQGLKDQRILVQRCTRCGIWQWGPEWICHACHGFDLEWVGMEGKGQIYSWERIWHPVHPVLAEAGPYLVVLVEMTHGIRMLGNLLGDPLQEVRIGDNVTAVFEHHPQASPPYTLLQWQKAGG